MPISSFNKKWIPFENLNAWTQSRRKQHPHHKLVATNGCFDILHIGHIRYLQASAQLGDFLLVGVNSDNSIRQIKGPDRPVNAELERAEVLAALECVNAITIFPDSSALNFLQMARPDIYSKGGDYSLDSINQQERQWLESIQCQIHIIPADTNQSTSKILRQLRVASPSPTPE